MLGPPGAGKGTQANLLSKKAGVPHISTGDIFRDAMKNGTPMGRRAAEFIQRGELVPDEVVIGIVEERLKEEDCRGGFILDGFPRTVAQAESLDKFLESKGISLDAVVEVVVSRDEVVRRLSNRRTCEHCQAVYHLIHNPPKEDGICDRCKGKLMQRQDDTIEVILNRLKVYERQTAPLAGYYEKKGRLLKIGGEKKIEEVVAEIAGKLGIHSPSPLPTGERDG